VDLDAPNHTFYVDLVGTDAFVYSERLNGPGGLPLSAQWKMLAVLDRGPFSILAAIAMMRRGCVVELFVPVSDAVERLSRETQRKLAEKLSGLVTRPNYKGFLLEMSELPLEQHTAAQLDSMIRRMAIKFAREKRFKGVVFGDVSGNLSSLLQMGSEQYDMPIFYPLLGLERNDLEDLSNLAGIDPNQLVSEISFQYHAENRTASTLEAVETPVVREVRF